MKNWKKKLLTSCLAVLSGVVISLGVACGGKTVEYTFATLGGNEISSVTVKEGETYELPAATREGYRFMGWYATENYTGEAITSVTALENATYYAKWEKLYTVTLNADGGTLANNVTSVQLIAGENVYDAVKELAPTKGELQFGAWFNGNAEITKSLSMPKQDLTLKAKYKAPYTVQFRNNKDEKIVINGEEVADVVDYAYVGASIDAEYSIKGHTEYDRTPMDALIVSETASENVITLKYEPNQISVNFYANYPNGGAQESVVCHVEYGETVELLSDYTTEGYCLIGWSTEKGGELKYAVDTVSKNMHGFEGEVTAESFIPEDTVSLFGVWKKGYQDAFTGDDYLYIFDETSTDVYLFRAGKYFKGVLYNNNKYFRFNDDGKRLIGQLYDNYTFLYSVSDREQYYTLFISPMEGMNENVKILFDSYDKITYSEKTDRGIEESTGTYKMSGTSTIVATFTDGALSGKTLTMNLGYVGKERAFQIRNDEEMMTLLNFVVYEGLLRQYKAGYNDLTLDGFGTATLKQNNSTGTYAYRVDGETIELYNKQSGQIVGYAKIMKYEGFEPGYMLYTPAMDGTFTLADGSTLTMDGTFTFTYTKEGKEYKGFYTSTQSWLGGMLVTAIDVATTPDEETVSFIFHVSQTKEADEVITNVVLKSSDYAEYLIKTDNIYYAPLIVLGEEPGKATVYGMNSKNQFVKKLYGTCVFDETTGRYVFVATETEDAAVEVVAGVDLSTVSGFTFAVDSTTYIYKIHYWYSYTDTENQNHNLVKTYTSESGEVLTLVAGYALYTHGTTTQKGLYSVAENIITVTLGSQKLYFEVTETEQEASFIKLLYLPYTITKTEMDGTTNKDEYISYDGKGGVTYVTATNEYQGTIVEVSLPEGEKIVGDPTVYKFTSTDASFTVTYILSSNNRFYVENSEYVKYRGRYTSNDGILQLDGFGMTAKYTSADNKDFISTYVFSGENQIRIYTDEIRYIDLNLQDKTFRLYGAEYGVNRVGRNSQATDTYIDFDGFGNCITYVEKDGVRSDEKTATYVVVDGEITVTFGDGSTWRGSSSIAILNDQICYIFYVVDETLVQTYVNETDWSVLILDGKGGATKYNANGIKDTGTYMMIAEDLLYFVNSAKKDAYVYRINMEDGTVSPPDHDDPIGYYTSSFESFIFTIYGYAVFNGETQYYYYEEDNGEVYIYRPLEDGEDRDALTAAGAEITKYDFVKTYFGKFDDLYTTWSEKNFFKNEGYDIQFTRTGASDGFAEEYPLPVKQGETAFLTELWFAPTSEATFFLPGLVYLSNGKTMDCTVTRRVVDDVLETFVSVGYYRYDIVITYDYDTSKQELVSTYEITRMRYFVEAVSYLYLNEYYMMYSNGITQWPNSYGVMSFYYEFTKTGEKSDMYADGEFYDLSGVKDLKGELISFTKAPVQERDNGIMTVTVQGSDNYSYHLSCGLQQHQQLRTVGYYVTAFIRLQQFAVTVGTDDFVLYVGRLVHSDLEEYAQHIGKVFEADLLKKNGEKYESILVDTMDIELLPVSETSAYLVLREKGNGGYVAYTYYEILFTEVIDGTVTEEKVVMPYATAVIEKHEARRLSTSSGSAFIEVIGSGAEQKIAYMFYGVNAYIIAGCEQDGDVFKVTTTTGETFTVTLEGDVIKSIVAETEN